MRGRTRRPVGHGRCGAMTGAAAAVVMEVMVVAMVVVMVMMVVVAVVVVMVGVMMVMAMVIVVVTVPAALPPSSARHACHCTHPPQRSSASRDNRCSSSLAKVISFASKRCSKKYKRFRL
jgi:hypothetical protein